MSENYFEPPLEETEFVLVGDEEVQVAASVLTACESCQPDVEISFDWLLDQVTGRNPRVTEYLMPKTVLCPCCGTEIGEKTLIEWNGVLEQLVRPVTRPATESGLHPTIEPHQIGG